MYRFVLFDQILFEWILSFTNLVIFSSLIQSFFLQHVILLHPLLGYSSIFQRMTNGEKIDQSQRCSCKIKATLISFHAIFSSPKKVDEAWLQRYPQTNTSGGFHSSMLGLKFVALQEHFNSGENLKFNFKL